MNNTKDLLASARQAAEEVQRESQPSLWERLRVWYVGWKATRERERHLVLCRKGLHETPTWTFLQVKKVFAAGDTAETAYPIYTYQVYTGICRWCNVPTSHKISI